MAMKLFKNSSLLCLSMMIFLTTFGVEPTLGGGSRSSKCDCQRLEDTKRIIGGEEADIHQYPFQVHVTSKYRANGRRYAGKCGGTLISSQWIITAAHCVMERSLPGSKPTIEIRIGEHAKSTSSETSNTIVLQTTTFIVHEGYEYKRKVVNDIALIKLDTPIQFTDAISPACLPLNDVRDKVFNGEKGTALGWGRNTADTQQRSDILKELQIRIYSIENCVYPKSNWDYGSVNEDMLCGSKPGQNVCHGDSGGPLVYKESGHSYVIGIGSFVWGPKCVYFGFPGIFLRVASYVDWIEETTGEKFCSA